MYQRVLFLGACMISAAGPAAVSAQQMHVSQQVAFESSAQTGRPVTNDNALATPVDADFQNVPLSQALDALARASNVRISYGSYVIPAGHRVSFRGKQVALGVALQRVLAGTGAAARLTPSGQITIAKASEGEREARQGVITGRVVHAKTKRPIAGATILLDNAIRGIVTGEDGTFRIPAALGTRTIHVRAIGMARTSRTITLANEDPVVVEIQLDASTSVLDEVIVTGTIVATERRAIPTPITVITAAELERRGITRIEQLLRGEVPGVVALEKGSAVYDVGNVGYGSPNFGNAVTANVYVRGTSNMVQGDPDPRTSPLKTFVDGVELLDPSYLGTIDPQSIERIEIITGPQAATIYGSGALGGVMQIFTKNGGGRSTPELTLNLRYGMLENNISNGRTPAHNHGVTVSGGTGAAFSYAGTLTYNYSGQWQPNLFSRTYGASVGATHTQGPLSATGSVAITAGRNGSGSNGGYVRENENRASGIWIRESYHTIPKALHRSTTGAQTVSMNVDYRPLSFWQHHLTLGRNQTDFGLIPSAPTYGAPSDTLLMTGTSHGQRVTASYNFTLQTPSSSVANATLTVGGNGSWGNQSSQTGCKSSSSATNFIGCDEWNLPQSMSSSDKNWGGFGSLQVGVLGRLFFTFGLRGESNPTYGREHKIDWTPTQGATYTMEHNDLTVKFLLSYGRSTRAPQPEWRKEIMMYEPHPWVSQRENLYLTPEYSRGPQGGIEVYYGNRGSFTVNRYRQTVTDLIQQIRVDTIYLDYGDYGYYGWQFQYVNAAKILQQGWEFTGSANAGPVSFKGTYTWSETQELAFHPLVPFYTPGSSALGLPTHTGSITVGYARGRTNVSFVTNWIGSSPQGGGTAWENNTRESRLQMYTARGAFSYDLPPGWTKRGYAKSDLAVTHRITPWVSGMLNVTNLGNSFGNDAGILMSTLGRQTLLGLSLRFPRGR